MKLMHVWVPALVFGLTGLSAAMTGCDKKSKVTVVEEKKEEDVVERGKSESQLRDEYEARKKARENAPEPKLDPKSAREKLELIWDRGKKRLDTVYNERADLTTALSKRLKKLEEVKEKKNHKLLKPLFKPLSEFGIGKLPAELENAPKEICDIILKVREPAHAIIVAAEKELIPLQKEIEELEKKADAGGTVYQRQWDKLDEKKLLHSSSIMAARQNLMFVRNILHEAEVVAHWGARRTQKALGKCLGEINAKGPLMYELTQEQLEKVIKRTKYYKP